MYARLPINSGIIEYVDSFISNSQRCPQLLDKICDKTEYDLILSIFDYVYQQKATDKRTYERILKILDDIYTVFDSISESNSTSSYCVSFNKFCASDKNKQESAISNFKLRLNFWKTFQ